MKTYQKISNTCQKDTKNIPKIYLKTYGTHAKKKRAENKATYQKHAKNISKTCKQYILKRFTNTKNMLKTYQKPIKNMTQIYPKHAKIFPKQHMKNISKNLLKTYQEHAKKIQKNILKKTYQKHMLKTYQKHTKNMPPINQKHAKKYNKKKRKI